jgi:hypothetical protein
VSNPVPFVVRFPTEILGAVYTELHVHDIMVKSAFPTQTVSTGPLLEIQRSRAEMISMENEKAITKSAYKSYLASEYWRSRRSRYLVSHPECNRCYVERKDSARIYDQDLHVHHRNYRRLGEELDSDLEALCRRCHEIESLGTSGLPEVCMSCGSGCSSTTYTMCSDCWNPSSRPSYEGTEEVF